MSGATHVRAHIERSDAASVDRILELHERGVMLAECDDAGTLAVSLAELLDGLAAVLSGEGSVDEERASGTHPIASADVAFWTKMELRWYRERLSAATTLEALAALQVDLVERFVRNILAVFTDTEDFDRRAIEAAIALRREYARLRHLAGTEPPDLVSHGELAERLRAVGNRIAGLLGMHRTWRLRADDRLVLRGVRDRIAGDLRAEDRELAGVWKDLIASLELLIESNLRATLADSDRALLARLDELLGARGSTAEIAAVLGDLCGFSRELDEVWLSAPEAPDLDRVRAIVTRWKARASTFPRTRVSGIR